MCLPVSDFDRYSLTIARWLTSVYDADDPAGNHATPGDVTVDDRKCSDQANRPVPWKHKGIREFPR